MKSIVTTRTIDIPVGVRFKIKSRKIQITGPRGKLVRDFKHVLVDLKSDTTKKKILLKVWFGNKKSLWLILAPSWADLISEWTPEWAQNSSKKCLKTDQKMTPKSLEPDRGEGDPGHVFKEKKAKHTKIQAGSPSPPGGNRRVGGEAYHLFRIEKSSNLCRFVVYTK